MCVRVCVWPHVKEWKENPKSVIPVKSRTDIAVIYSKFIKLFNFSIFFLSRLLLNFCVFYFLSCYFFTWNNLNIVNILEKNGRKPQTGTGQFYQNQKKQQKLNKSKSVHFLSPSSKPFGTTKCYGHHHYHHLHHLMDGWRKKLVYSKVKCFTDFDSRDYLRSLISTIKCKILNFFLLEFDWPTERKKKKSDANPMNGKRNFNSFFFGIFFFFVHSIKFAGETIRFVMHFQGLPSIILLLLLLLSSQF